jgi:hypothetical protein
VVASLIRRISFEDGYYWQPHSQGDAPFFKLLWRSSRIESKPDLDEMELEDLVFEAQRLMRVWWEAKADGGGRKPPGRKTTIDLRREIAVDFGGNEALRARAFSELAAALGEIRPDVEGF